MKRLNFKNTWTLAVLLFGILLIHSCQQKNEWGANFEKNENAPKITKVFLENTNSDVPDRQVTFARLGQTIRIEGENLLGITKVFINGYESAFNPTLMSNISMVLQVSSKVPTMEADDAVRNTIRIEKGDKFTIYEFEVRSAAPSITSVSHTMPAAGDVITIIGTGLQEVSDVEFPGGVKATEFSSNEKGTEVTVTVPAGITESGSILVIGVNGGAYSAANFNFKEGLLHNFDDVQNYAWGSGVDNTALTAVIPASGLTKSQGGYQAFNAAGSLSPMTDQRFWLNSTNVIAIMNKIPSNTSTDDCGIQMDIYVDGAWESGIIRFVMADGWGASRYCMIYQPVYVNGSYDKAAFVNPGSWFTITLPFGISSDFGGKTLGDVIAQMEQASYKQAGPWFENSGIPDVFDAVSAKQKVYFDNIRIVPLTKPAYSDFAD